MNKNIFFVILAYRPEIKNFNKHLIEFANFSHVVIDNIESFNCYATKTKVIHTGKNLGYAGGMTKGIDHCLEHGAQWIVVTNDDLEIDKKSINDIAVQLEKTPEGVAGPFTGGLDPIRWSTIYPQIQNPTYISGSCMAIHRNVIKKIGKFYEPYFIYYEDVELSVRAVKAGFALTHLELKGIVHHESTTMNKMTALRSYYHARNHLLFVERNAPVSVKAHELLRLPKTYYEHIQQKDFGGAAGVRDYVLRRFGKKEGLS
jgi:hypothetical protein